MKVVGHVAVKSLESEWKLQRMSPVAHGPAVADGRHPQLQRPALYRGACHIPTILKVQPYHRHLVSMSFLLCGPILSLNLLFWKIRIIPFH